MIARTSLLLTCAALALLLAWPSDVAADPQSVARTSMAGQLPRGRAATHLNVSDGRGNLTVQSTEALIQPGTYGRDWWSDLPRTGHDLPIPDSAKHTVAGTVFAIQILKKCNTKSGEQEWWKCVQRLASALQLAALNDTSGESAAIAGIKATVKSRDPFHGGTRTGEFVWCERMSDCLGR